MKAVLLLALASCTAMFAPGASTGGMQPMHSAPSPTTKTKADLDAQVDQLLAKYQAGKTTSGTLDALAPVAIDGKRGMCYAVVMRLDDGATWDRGAQGGMIFDMKMPSGPAGKSGPGLIGPGAIGMTTCADASGPITMKLAAIDGNRAGAPIGHGGYTVQVYSHKQTAEEARAVAEDQRDQDQRFQKYQAEEAAKANAICDRCQTRYEGCRGAGRSESTCRSEYSQCAFDGGDYKGACQVHGDH